MFATTEKTKRLARRASDVRNDGVNDNANAAYHPDCDRAQQPSCWLSEGTSYVRGICRSSAKDKRSVEDIKGFVGEPEKVPAFLAACKKAGISFREAATKQMAVNKAVTCKGEQTGAHTLIIGKCSFEGAIAGQVIATCKNENDVCQVQAHGWENRQGIYIITSITSVESVKLGD